MDKTQKGKVFKIFNNNDQIDIKFTFNDVMKVLKELNNQIKPDDVRGAFKNSKPFKMNDLKVEKHIIDLCCDICDIKMSCISIYNNHMATNLHLARVEAKEHCIENNIEWTKEKGKDVCRKMYKKNYYKTNQDNYHKYYIKNRERILKEAKEKYIINKSKK